jgi:hypothetical protein
MISLSKSFASENESERRAEDLCPKARALCAFTLVFEVATGTFFTLPEYHDSIGPGYLLNRTLPTSPFRGKSPLAGAARIWYRG